MEERHINIVLISGGTAGIGKSVVTSLLTRGHTVVTFAPDEPGVAALIESCSELPGTLVARTGDVTSDTDVETIVSETMSQFGRIDVLINNAGIPYYADCEAIEMDQFKHALDVNLLGAVRLIKAVTPHMKEAGSGTIVNLVSTAGIQAHARSKCYAATKFALRGFSQGLRMELRPFGIRVTVVSPGVADTNFLGCEAKKRDDAPGSLLNTADIAEAISYIIDQPAHVEIRDIVMTPLGSDRYRM